MIISMKCADITIKIQITEMFEICKTILGRSNNFYDVFKTFLF